MTPHTKLPLKDRLHGIAAFLPLFEHPGFTFGDWDEPEYVEPGVMTMPNFNISGVAYAFNKTAYDLGWVRTGFNWPDWAQSPEAIRLRDDPESMARATPDQISCLLTVIIRQERFCEGALETAFESGLVTAICRRAAQLESEIDDGEE